VIGVLVAGLTAFYMFRLYFGIFWGKDTKYEQKPHESPVSMTFPLVFLAFMSIGAGYIHFSEYITADHMSFEAHLNYPLAAIAVGVGLVGILLAFVFYKKPSGIPEKVSQGFGSLYQWAYDKFYFDELYLFITKEIIFKRISAPFAWFDRNVVDGTMNLIGNSTVSGSEKIKKIQSGKLQDYAFAFIAGIVVLAMIFIYKWII